MESQIETGAYRDIYIYTCIHVYIYTYRGCGVEWRITRKMTWSTSLPYCLGCRARHKSHKSLYPQIMNMHLPYYNVYASQEVEKSAQDFVPPMPTLIVGGVQNTYRNSKPKNF